MENRIGLDQQYAALAALARNRSQTDRSIDTTASACSAASIFFSFLGDNPQLHPALQLRAALLNFQHHKGRTPQTKSLDPGTWLSLVV